MKMKKWLVALIGGFALSGCQLIQCLPVDTKSQGIVNGVTYPGFIRFKLGERWIYGGAYVQPYRSYCGKLPKDVYVEWSDETIKGGSKKAVVHIGDKIPKGFMSNPYRLLTVAVDGNDKPHVYFRLKLSDIVTRFQEEPETADEVRQRHLYEQLWRAVKADDLLLVKSLVEQGAPLSYERLLMTDLDIPYPKINGWRRMWTQQPIPVFGLAILRGNKALLEYMLTLDDISTKLFQHKNMVSAFVLEKDYIALEIFLEHGASPNTEYEAYATYEPVSDAAELLNKYATVVYPTVASVGAPIFKDRVLYQAASSNDIKAVGLLLDHGASVDFVTHEGQPFVEWAKVHASEEINGLIQASRQ